MSSAIQDDALYEGRRVCFYRKAQALTAQVCGEEGVVKRHENKCKFGADGQAVTAEHSAAHNPCAAPTGPLSCTCASAAATRALHLWMLTRCAWTQVGPGRLLACEWTLALALPLFLTLSLLQVLP